MDNFLKIGALYHAKLISAPGPEALDKAYTGEQNMKSVHVFRNTAIYVFGITELPLDNQERMLDCSAYRGFPIFNVSIPVETFIASWNLQTGWSDICSKFDPSHSK